MDFKVALISYEYPPFVFGGIGLHSFDLARSISKKSIDVTVFCGKSKRGKIEKISQNLTVVRLPLLDLPPRHLWFQLQNLNTVSRLLKEYDVVHGVNSFASSLFTLLRKKKEWPFVTSIHEVFNDDLKVFTSAPLTDWTFKDFLLHFGEYPLYDFLTKKALNNAERTVICGSWALERFKKLYPDLNYSKFSVIYNGIDFERIPKVTAEDNHSKIIFFGRLLWTKGVLHLLEAVKIIARDFPDVTLDIYGDGPLKQKVFRQINKLKLDDRVTIKGYLPNADLLQRVSKASIAVFPSFYEIGPSISVMEAMACHKPIVAFDMPFTREFVKDRSNGLLCKKGNVSDLAEKISILLSDKSLREKIGTAAFNYIKENHSWDKIGDKYVNLYKEVHNEWSES